MTNTLFQSLLFRSLAKSLRSTWQVYLCVIKPLVFSTLAISLVFYWLMVYK